MPLLILPRATVIGDIIAYANESASSREGRKIRYTFAGAEYFKRMKEINVYTTDVHAINRRISQLNLNNITIIMVKNRLYTLCILVYSLFLLSL